MKPSPVELGDLPLMAVIGLKEKEQSLAHYDVKKMDNTTIECWISAIEGEEFEIWCRGQNRTRKQKSLDIRAVIWLDDVEMDPAVFLREKMVDDICGRVTGQPVGKRKIRPFTFKKMELTDDDTKFIEFANTITVELEWGTAKPISEMQEFTDPRGQNLVHKCSVRAGNPYAAGLGDIKPSSVGVHEYEFTPAKGMPTFTFVFRYASQEWLEAQGIAPRPGPPKSESPSPKKSESPPPKAPKRETRKRNRGKTSEVIDLIDIKSEPDSSDEAPTTSRNKRRKVKVEEDIKPKFGNK